MHAIQHRDGVASVAPLVQMASDGPAEGLPHRAAGKFFSDADHDCTLFNALALASCAGVSGGLALATHALPSVPLPRGITLLLAVAIVSYDSRAPPSLLD